MIVCRTLGQKQALPQESPADTLVWPTRIPAATLARLHCACSKVTDDHWHGRLCADASGKRPTGTAARPPPEVRADLIRLLSLPAERPEAREVRVWDQIERPSADCILRCSDPSYGQPEGLAGLIQIMQNYTGGFGQWCDRHRCRTRHRHGRDYGPSQVRPAVSGSVRTASVTPGVTASVAAASPAASLAAVATCTVSRNRHRSVCVQVRRSMCAKGRRLPADVHADRCSEAVATAADSLGTVLTA
jgi:hypothetical protein